MAKPTMWQRLTGWGPWTTTSDARTPRILFGPVLPPDQRECPRCHEIVTIWRTYTDGRIFCVPCGEKERPL